MARHPGVDRVESLAETADRPCPFCLQRYALHMEIRCVACDRPACPVCVVRVRQRRETLCPECDAEGTG